jgi:hypothetical protein
MKTFFTDTVGGSVRDMPFERAMPSFASDRLGAGKKRKGPNNKVVVKPKPRIPGPCAGCESCSLGSIGDRRAGVSCALYKYTGSRVNPVSVHMMHDCGDFRPDRTLLTDVLPSSATCDDCNAGDVTLVGDMLLGRRKASTNGPDAANESGGVGGWPAVTTIP